MRQLFLAMLAIAAFAHPAATTPVSSTLYQVMPLVLTHPEFFGIGEQPPPQPGCGDAQIDGYNDHGPSPLLGLLTDHNGGKDGDWGPTNFGEATDYPGFPTIGGTGSLGDTSSGFSDSGLGYSSVGRQSPDASVSVPEPGSLAMLASVLLAGLLFWMNRLGLCAAPRTRLIALRSHSLTDSND